MRISIILSAALGLLSLAGQVHAGPARCAAGYQDASCRGVLNNAPQTPPSCPSDPGYTTTRAPQWAGSKFTAPECSYTPAPTCPAGYEPTTPATWNGSQWVGLSCTKITPQPPPINNTSVAWSFSSGAMPFSCGGAAFYRTQFRISDAANRVINDSSMISEGLSYECVPPRTYYGQFEISTVVWGNGAVTNFGVYQIATSGGFWGADFSAGAAYGNSIGCVTGDGWRTRSGMPLNGSNNTGGVFQANNDQSDSLSQPTFGFAFTLICPAGVTPQVHLGGLAGNLPQGE